MLWVEVECKPHTEIARNFGFVLPNRTRSPFVPAEAGTQGPSSRTFPSLGPRFRAWALKCPFYSLIAPLARWFIDIAREHVVASTQARQSRLRDDGLDEDGDKLFEHAPGAGPGQAAASTGGESSSSSTSGSSKRMMRR